MIAVEKATYDENLNITKEVTILAESGTVIHDAFPNEDVFNIESNNTTIANFIIDADPASGDGHYARHAISVTNTAHNVALINNTIRNASSPDLTSAGIHINGTNIQVIGNTVTDSERGILVTRNPSTHYISKNSISVPSSDSSMIGVKNTEDSTVVIRSTTIQSGDTNRISGLVSETDTGVKTTQSSIDKIVESGSTSTLTSSTSQFESYITYSQNVSTTQVGDTIKFTATAHTADGVSVSGYTWSLNGTSDTGETTDYTPSSAETHKITVSAQLSDETTVSKTKFVEVNSLNLVFDSETDWTSGTLTNMNVSTSGVLSSEGTTTDQFIDVDYTQDTDSGWSVGSSHVTYYAEKSWEGDLIFHSISSRGFYSSKPSEFGITDSSWSSLNKLRDLSITGGANTVRVNDVSIQAGEYYYITFDKATDTDSSSTYFNNQERSGEYFTYHGSDENDRGEGFSNEGGHTLTFGDVEIIEESTQGTARTSSKTFSTELTIDKVTITHALNTGSGSVRVIASPGATDEEQQTVTLVSGTNEYALDSITGSHTDVKLEVILDGGAEIDTVKVRGK